MVHIAEKQENEHEKVAKRSAEHDAPKSGMRPSEGAVGKEQQRNGQDHHPTHRARPVEQIVLVIRVRTRARHVK